MLFVLVAGAADANAQATTVAPPPGQHKKTDESVKAAPGTYVFLFRENHHEVVSIGDHLLHKIETIRKASGTVYLRINDNILVKVLPPGSPAPVVNEDDFISIDNGEFNELLQQSVLYEF